MVTEDRFGGSHAHYVIDSGLHSAFPPPLPVAGPAQFLVGQGLPGTTCWSVANSSACIQQCSRDGATKSS